MTSVQPNHPKRVQRKTRKLQDIYSNALLTKHISLSITNIGSNIKELLEQKIASSIEGKCIPEGFIRPNSVKLLTYSSGKVNGLMIRFEAVFECQICLPVEGMLIECKSKNITKAGIKAEIESDDMVSPVIIFIARDHHYMTPYFSTIEENQTIKVRVIGQRFELNDRFISIIAELIEPSEQKQATDKKPKLILGDEDVMLIKPKKKKRKPKLVLSEQTTSPE